MFILLGIYDISEYSGNDVTRHELENEMHDNNIVERLIQHISMIVLLKNFVI